MRDEAKVDDFGRVHLLLLGFVDGEVDAFFGGDGLADVYGLLPHEDFLALAALLLLLRKRLLDYLALALRSSIFRSSMLL